MYDATQVLTPVFQKLGVLCRHLKRLRGVQLDDRLVQWAAPKLASTPGARMEAVFIDPAVAQQLPQFLPLVIYH